MLLLEGTTNKKKYLSSGAVRSLPLKVLSSKSTLIKIDWREKSFDLINNDQPRHM